MRMKWMGQLSSLAAVATAITIFATTSTLWVSATQEKVPTSTITTTNTRQRQPEAYQQRLVDWLLKDPDGFFHPSIVFRRGDDDDNDNNNNSGSYAMHVTTAIPKGTPLIVLPRKYVLESGIPSDGEFIDPRYDPRMCTTVEKMIHELEHTTMDDKTSSSFYAPYLSYLFHETPGGTSRGIVPGTWSDESKAILDLVLNHTIGDSSHGGSSLMPDAYDYLDFFEICESVSDFWGDYFDLSNEVTKSKEALAKTNQIVDAYIFLLSRGWFDKLIPIIDNLNHRNGPLQNVEVTAISDRPQDIAAYAIRDIEAGEELQYTYSECMDSTCEFGEIMYTFSTQAIFSDFGFVELYPQRWNIDTGYPEPKHIFTVQDEPNGKYVYDEEHWDAWLEIGKIDLPFEVSENHKRVDENGNVEITAATLQDITVEVYPDETSSSSSGGGGGELVLKWIFEEPNEYTIAWIQRHLDRLKGIESEVKQGLENLSFLPEIDGVAHNWEYESETILELYEGYVTVLELALKHQEDEVHVTWDEFKVELAHRRKTRTLQTIDELKKHPLLVEQQQQILSQSTSSNANDEL